MKKILFAFMFVFLFLVGFVSAVPATEVSYFYSTTCSHCAKVAESGILDELSIIENVTVNKYEISSPVNRERYLEFARRLNLDNSGVPFMIML